MGFDGSVSENLRGLLPENGQIFLILMLNQLSQRRKMRLEQANLIKIIAKLYELFF